MHDELFNPETLVTVAVKTRSSSVCSEHLHKFISARRNIYNDIYILRMSEGAVTTLTELKLFI